MPSPTSSPTPIATPAPARSTADPYAREPSLPRPPAPTAERTGGAEADLATGGERFRRLTEYAGTYAAPYSGATS